SQARLDQAEQQIGLNSADQPMAVLLDPDHDFLREMPTLHWAAEELPFILKYASNPVDRQEAMNQMLADARPSDTTVQAVTEAVRADRGQFPVFRDVERLGDLKLESLRPLF